MGKRAAGLPSPYCVPASDVSHARLTASPAPAALRPIPVSGSDGSVPHEPGSSGPARQAQEAPVHVATNQVRIAGALDLLTRGLSPYVERRLKAVYGDAWRRNAGGSFRDDRERGDGRSIDWDAHSVLTVMWDQWNAAFRTELGHTERSLVSELREFRNRWAHQAEFDFDDTFRVLDSVRRLLSAADAPQVEEVKRLKTELLEAYVAEEVNTQIQQASFRRNKIWVIAIYVVCVLFLLLSMLMADGNNPVTIALASVVVLAMVYLMYQQFKMDPPLLYGPRECPSCHKIVYRKPCPYCGAGA
jgi:hypothetical protein